MTLEILKKLLNHQKIKFYVSFMSAATLLGPDLVGYKLSQKILISIVPRAVLNYFAVLSSLDTVNL